MKDAATVWISPAWFWGESEESGIAPRVYAMNPHQTQSAEVSVSYFKWNGTHVGGNIHSVPPQRMMSLHPTPDHSLDTAKSGWLRIWSELPVLPWGVTMWHDPDGWHAVNMSFYRDEPSAIKLGPWVITRKRNGQ